ncbi:hypothetical protein IFM89_000010 [Coptis chinensis]|uniref:Uncharacterized protein n=1 Tax=Coptis chinensis TaxID=261450 RepID=A0A835IIZ7_9MAGN|nr:hypothetical protein IFM89_000010 [Coptis chinensis]
MDIKFTQAASKAKQDEGIRYSAPKFLVPTTTYSSWSQTSEAQEIFLQGGSVQGGIDLAFKLSNEVKNKTFGASLGIKVDISQAYDIMS